MKKDFLTVLMWFIIGTIMGNILIIVTYFIQKFLMSIK